MQSLPKRLTHCVLGHEPFERGMEYVSFLDQDGNRKDFCLLCWAKSDNKVIKGHFWKGKVPLKKEKMYQPDEKALALLRSSTDPKHKFVLALYLQRKAQLVRRTQTLYEDVETGELFDIERISLSAEEGEALAKEIHAVIN